MEELLARLDEKNVTSAAFFIDPAIPANSSVVASARGLGYDVHAWSDKEIYDPRYPPTEFENVTLSDRAVLSRTNKMADVASFYNLALHSSNSSTIAFTPAMPPEINHSMSVALLDEILSDDGRTLVYTSEQAGRTATVPISVADAPAADSGEAIGSNTTSSIVLDAGTWNMSRLHTRYPADIAVVSTQDGNAYLVDTSIIVGEDAQVNIADAVVRIISPEDGDRDRRIEVQGNLTISDSTISSWDNANNTLDDNPYHQRPFIFVEEGGLSITNSSISNLGFLQSGFGEDRDARAAIIIHESNGFSIINSSLAHNFDALYARNSSGATIGGNEFFANMRTAIDIRSGSSDLRILDNNVHDNGYEGIVCIECFKSAISGNTVEHNKEAGIKLIYSNFTGIRENTLSHNEKFGIFLRDNSTQNAIQANTVSESREGIRLSGNSSNNFLFENDLMGNDEGIDADESSRPNQQRNNRVPG
jgi:parallel beta-helix repeat protein